MVGSVTTVVANGLQAMQGIYFAETFYWDLNDRTRAFMSRIKPRLPPGVLPNNVHAGNYAATMHYLKTVKQQGVANAKAFGRAMVEAMKAMPTDDDCFGQGMIRADGRKIHPTYLFQIKAPAESHGPGDVYKVAGVTPADQACRAPSWLGRRDGGRRPQAQPRASGERCACGRAPPLVSGVQYGRGATHTSAARWRGRS